MFSGFNHVLSKLRDNLKRFKEKHPDKDVTEREVMVAELEEFQLWAYELFQKAEANDRAFYNCSKVCKQQWYDIKALETKVSKLEQTIESMKEFYE